MIKEVVSEKFVIKKGLRPHVNSSLVWFNLVIFDNGHQCLGYVEDTVLNVRSNGGLKNRYI